MKRHIWAMGNALCSRLGRVGVIVTAWALSGIALYLVLSQFDLRLLLRVSATTLIAVVVLLILSKVVYVLPISRLLSNLGYRVRYGPLFLILEASYAGNYLAPARVGIPLRILLYRHVLQVPASAGTAATIVGHFIWFLLILTVAAVGLLAQATDLSVGLVVTALVALFFGIASVLIIPFDRMRATAAKLPAGRIWLRLLHFISAVQLAMKQVEWTTSLLYVSVVALKLGVHAVVIYLFLSDLGSNVAGRHVLWALCVSLVVGVITLLPMGAGAQDISLLLLLTRVGVARELAGLAVLADRVVYTAVPLATGLISANILGVDLLNRSAPDGVSSVSRKDDKHNAH